MTLRFIIGTAFWFFVCRYFDRRYIRRDKYLDEKYRKMREEETQRSRYAERTLVREEEHPALLRWLNDAENFPEIQNHVREVLREIWEREVAYTVYGDASRDIRCVIYFVENGFLPGICANAIRVQYHTGGPGSLQYMTDDEFRRLKRWIKREFRKRGTEIYLADGIHGGEWRYV